MLTSYHDRPVPSTFRLPVYGKRIGAIQAFLRGLEPEEARAAVARGFIDVFADQSGAG